VDDRRRRIGVCEKGAIKMTDDNGEHRREKLRALRQLRGQSERRQEPILEAPYEDGPPDRNEREGANSPRRAKLRELLQRHRAEGGDAVRPGDGRLRRALAERAGAGIGEDRSAARASGNDPPGVADNNGDRPALSGEPAVRGEWRGRLGSRAMLRRLIQAQQNSGGAGSNTNTRLLVSELQSCVQQLTEEVVRLRTNRAGKAPIKKRKSAAAGKKPKRVVKKV
jgi:hypothetical protein